MIEHLVEARSRLQIVRDLIISELTHNAICYIAYLWKTFNICNFIQRQNVDVVYLLKIDMPSQILRFQIKFAELLQILLVLLEELQNVDNLLQTNYRWIFPLVVLFLVVYLRG